ncbi:hypothetical protein H0H93_007926 [Arthromyces matolae]|nr:hypothetical protein H0H93_007926 [Arthromyces matolae]
MILGYHGFHPPRTGQDEDILSENNVKNGFTLNQQVLAETFSANTMINGDLSSETTFSKLETLMNEIFIRKAENLPSIPPATFRIPARVTLNDAKRQSWFADLANPDVPLYRLGKSVPHGAKGHDLLDLLQAKNIAIPRAVWFLRVFGANETAGLRNKPTYNPMQYSTDWANVVTSYMKKQLADIALPSAPRPGLNIKQTFKGVLSDGDSRERWLIRGNSLKLLRSFYSEGLVDKRIFLVWVVQQIMTCNLAQTGFITRLADEYLDGLLACRPLARPLLQACLAKLIERLCVALPDSFVSPRMWKTYNLLLAEILNQNVTGQCGNSPVERNTHEVSQVLSRYFVDIKKRNEALLFQSLPVQDPVPAHLGSAVSDIKFFTPSTYSDAGFSDKLDMLLTWSVTPLQFGDHRPFAAVTIIRNWRMDAADRATRRHASLPDEFLQDRLFDWLDSSDAAGDPENIRAVSLLFGKLVKNDLFSYASYVQRLIARGETGLSTSEVRSNAPKCPGK